MEIKKTNVKIKCDMAGCKNIADYCIENSENSRYNFNVCTTCLKELHKQFIFTCYLYKMKTYVINIIEII